LEARSMTTRLNDPDHAVVGSQYRPADVGRRSPQRSDEKKRKKREGLRIA
jgi:hypothetical protein